MFILEGTIPINGKEVPIVGKIDKTQIEENMSSIINKITINSETVSKTIDDFRNLKTNNNPVINEDFPKKPLNKNDKVEIDTETNITQEIVTHSSNINESSESSIQIVTEFDDNAFEDKHKDFKGKLIMITLS